MDAKLIVLSCLVALCMGAPQLKQVFPSPSIAPQLISNGRYLQPQLIRTGYQHPQLYNGYPLPYNGYQLPYNGYLQGLRGEYAYNGLTGLRTVAPQPVLKNAVLPVVASNSKSAAILRQAQDATLDGAYSYGFASEDGIAVETNAGPLTPVGPEEAVQTVTGSFSYTAPDGTPITTNWIADENGYRAEGAHLPKAPEESYRRI